jgi:NitT/TauT family transport system ATP-binding protein
MRVTDPHPSCDWTSSETLPYHGMRFHSQAWRPNGSDWEEGVTTTAERGAAPRPGPDRTGARRESAGAAPAVEVSGVEHVFSASDDREVVALSGIDLTVRTGEFVSLTLLRLVADLITPTTGTVHVNGKPARAARSGREYGMIFQTPVLFDWRTVERNVGLPLEILGVSRSDRDQRVSGALGTVELADFARHHPWQLSGGMQQRVAIARALVLEPTILLMDEPFGALDEMTRERMNLELHSIWERMGTTIVFVTHSIPEAVFLSTRVIVMSPRPGRIIDEIAIDLPRERTVETRESTRYFQLVTQVRESLRAEESRSSSLERAAAEGLA